MGRAFLFLLLLFFFLVRWEGVVIETFGFRGEGPVWMMWIAWWL